MDREDHPCVSFFPALPLGRNLDLGDWLVGNPPKETRWRSERFRTLATDLLASFEKLGFESAALVWQRDRGFDGVRPTDDQIKALGAAVSFAVLDANDALASDDVNKGHFLATAENAAFYVQPIDEATEFITHVKGGGLRRILVAGMKIGQEPIPLPDATVPMARPIVLSGKLARAIFDLMGKHDDPARHVQIALEWHRAAMTNPEAVTLQQRLIALKTGFEALFGESTSWRCAQRLRQHFEIVTANHLDCLPWSGLLWSPKERTDLARTYTERDGSTKSATRSELEDWFMTLAEARNSIIHDGVVSTNTFAAPPERPLSRYAGPLFWVGERLLREAIKGFLGPEILLCAPLARREAWKPVVDALLAQVAERADRRDGCEKSSKGLRDDSPGAAPPRCLDELLRELGGVAANQVTLSKVHGGASASEEVARQMAESMRDKWGADAGSISLLISRAERDLLETAGAEEAIPDYWIPCD